jgi:NADH-quinone oxidoreductase subunit N
MLVIWLSSDYFVDATQSTTEYYALVLFSVLGAMLMAISEDFLIFFLALQLTSIPLYILAGYARTDARSNEAAVKFLFLGMIASVIMLYGISLIYGLTGTVSYSALQRELASATAARPAIAMAIVFVLTGFAFKASAVPFHFWVPDTYEGAPTPATTFLATVPKVAGIAALVRFFFIVVGRPELVWTHDVIAVSAVLTMTVGNLMALTQVNIKRMLAYSSVTHIGYMLIAFAVGSRDAFSAISFYLIVYILANLGAFAVVMAVSRVDKSHLIESYTGLSSRSPLLAWSMLLFLLSMLGIPPTPGFWGKFGLFQSAVEQGMTWLAVVAIVNSLISAVYYINVVRYMFVVESPETAKRIKVPALITTVIVVVLVGTVLLGLFPGPGPVFRWTGQIEAVAGRFRQ